MTDSCGIPAGTIPGFAEAGGGQFMSVKGLPDRTVRNMVTFMDKLRGKPDIRFSTRAGRRPVPAARTLPPGTVPRTGRPWPPVPSRPLSPQVPVRPAAGAARRAGWLVRCRWRAARLAARRLLGMWSMGSAGLTPPAESPIVWSLACWAGTAVTGWPLAARKRGSWR